MKLVISLTMFILSSSLFSQNKPIKLEKFTSSAGNPEIIHQNDKFVYVKHYKTQKIYSFLKSDMTLKNSFKSKSRYGVIYRDSTLINIVLDKKENKVYVHSYNLNTSKLVKKDEVGGLEGAKALYSRIVCASTDKSKICIRISYIDEVNRNRYNKYYIVDKNFRVLSVLDLKFSYRDPLEIDNDGSIYLLTDNHIYIYNALKDFEKTTLSVNFENQVSLTGGVIYDIRIKFYENNPILFGLYKDGDFFYRSSHLAMIKIENFSKEATMAKLIPYSTSFSSDNNVTINKDGSFLFTELDRQLNGAGTNNYKEFSLAYFSKTGEKKWEKRIANNHMYTANLWGTYDYNGYGAVISNKTVNVFYNISLKNKNKFLYSNIISPNSDSIGSYSYKFKLKTAKKMETTMLSFDINTGKELKSEIVYTKDDKKINKVWLVPSLTTKSDSNDKVYVIGNKRINVILRFFGFCYGNASLNLNQKIGVLDID